MNIVEIAEELQEYLKNHNGNRRNLEALEESVEQLKQDLPKERREQEIRRLGEMLSFHLEKEEEESAGRAVDLEEKRRFTDKIHAALAQCREECVSLANRKAMEQTPLVKQLEEGFLVEMNAGLNGGKMQERESFSRLVRDCRNNMSARIRPVISDFSKALINEYDFCMEAVRKKFAETNISDYKVSYQEMNGSVLVNYDTMKKDILAVCENYEYPAEPFDRFSRDMGEKAQKLATKERRITVLLKLLPVLLFAVKYLWDNYLFPKETWMDKLMAVLLEWLEKAAGTGSEFLLQIAEVVLQFAKDNTEAFTFTSELLLLILFAGWIYFIYIKIVGLVRKKSLCRKLQMAVAPEAEAFLHKLDLQGELQRVFLETEKRVAESNLKKHRLLFEKLTQEEAGESQESELRKLHKEYLRYAAKGGE